MSALPLMWKGAVNVELWPQERVFMSHVNHTEPLNVSAQQHPQGRLERLALLPLKVLNMLANLTNEISPLALVVMSLERYGARAPVPPVLSSEAPQPPPVVAMVQMMESQCEYFMYFPAVPITDLSDPARYRTLPRRSHLYLGETVRFLLVLRCRDAGATPTEQGSAGGGDSAAAAFGSESASGRVWRELAGSLCAVASVSPGEGSRHRGNHHQHHHDYQSSGDEANDDGEEDYIAAAEAAIAALGSRVDSRCRSFRDCKPLLIHNSSGTASREFRRAPVQSPLDEPVVLTDEVIFPLTVSLDKLPVSTLKVKSRYRIIISVVLNESSQEEVSIRDVRILPNLNASYLPMMPDGSVLLVDNVCHQSGEVGMASYCRVDSLACRLPSMLSALEEHDFLFQLHLNDMKPDDSNEAAQYPSGRAAVRHDGELSEHRQGEGALQGRGQVDDAALAAVVCHTPLSNLGQCRKGSTLSFSVSFQILKPGLYELSQHMKLKLQFTASVSNPPPDARPLSRKNSPSSPAMRDLLDRHQASLGRSQSFSHQQPSRSHIMRTGSAMERRAITPPVGSPVGRPLYLPPQDKSLLSLDKIAKRECKVLVVDPVG
ncbi:hypothetical protein F2P81_024798 [Scophthalmus maximus]|uniref:Uncharacterized protein n=1 Tax=Scophthalmus maximus TaxID=52904 RepID=A0A6A4RR81_SCOMX|nr:hypothetical protein F2P81_024798 [Scophthalmus maximus]